MRPCFWMPVTLITLPCPTCGTSVWICQGAPACEALQQESNHSSCSAVDLLGQT